MKREDVLKEYKTQNGKIVSPGKFEAEPIFAPYFWDSFLNGFFDDELEDGTLVFNVEPFDVEEFPELAGIKKVFLFESETGFIYSETERA